MEPEVKAEESKAPMSLRDSIRSAIEETTKKDEVVDEKPIKEAKKEEIKDELPELEDIEDNKETDDKEEKEPLEAKEPSEKEEPVEASDKEQKEDKTEAPGAWKNEAEWDKIPASVQKRIAKREQEVAEGIKQYSEKAKGFDEYEKFVGPRRQIMAQLGVSPAQVVERALDWMDALGHPNAAVKSDAFRLLAKNYGIDLASLTGDNRSGESARVAGQEGLDPEYIQQLIRENVEAQTKGTNQQLQAMLQAQEAQQNAAAAAYVQGWAKDKSHFEQVKVHMGQLLQSGAIPLKNGQPDLDKAYEVACYANEDIRKLTNLEKARQAKIEKEAKSKKEEAERKAKIAKAKLASNSLTPNPGAPASGKSSKSNGADVPVGKSIRDAIAQLRAQ